MTYYSLNKLKDKTPFELMVEGVTTEEDMNIISNLQNNANIRQTLNLPDNLTVDMIKESDIQGRARLRHIDAAKPKNRARIVKELYLEKLGTQELPDDEYMAVAVRTDAHTEEEAKELIKTEGFESELEKNISIQLLVSPDPEKKDSVFSLSAIINDWLKAIQKPKKSIIGITLPIPTKFVEELDRLLGSTWEVLTKA